MYISNLLPQGPRTPGTQQLVVFSLQNIASWIGTKELCRCTFTSLQLITFDPQTFSRAVPNMAIVVEHKPQPRNQDESSTQLTQPIKCVKNGHLFLEESNCCELL